MNPAPSGKIVPFLAPTTPDAPRCKCTQGSLVKVHTHNTQSMLAAGPPEAWLGGGGRGAVFEPIGAALPGDWRDWPSLQDLAAELGTAPPQTPDALMAVIESALEHKIIAPLPLRRAPRLDDGVDVAAVTSELWRDDVPSPQHPGRLCVDGSAFDVHQLMSFRGDSLSENGSGSGDSAADLAMAHSSIEL